MMHDPRFFFQHQQKGFEFTPEQMTSCAQYSSGYYPQQQQQMQQNGNFYAETPSCMEGVVDEPVYDPKRRFSPPQIDSPPIGHRDMSFDGSSMMMDPSKYCEQQQQQPANFSSHFPQQQPPPQQPQQQPQESHEKFDRRKISVHANFYNYHMPYDERPREVNRQPPVFAQPAEPNWRKQSAHTMQMNPPPQRKFSHPVEVMVSPPCVYDQPLSYPQEQMLSPQPLKREVSFGDSPMETEPARKKSSLSANPPSRKNSGAPRRHANIPTRKASQMATKSQLRAPRFGDTATTYTPPPILSPMRNGTGLFWQACKGLAQNNQVYASGAESVAPPLSTMFNGEDVEMSDESPGLKIDEAAGPSEVAAPEVAAPPPADKAGYPARKKGFFYMASTMNQPNFADELEALRKESIASTSSHRSADDAYRKSSMRKLSTMSNVEMEPVLEEEEAATIVPRASDATPHINVGSLYQAKVYKWKEREISNAEREAIEDKDQIIFSVDVLEGIEEKQIRAYELLACSQAVPNPGRNKELALHLLMENRGNIEAAVADLLRSDTLDWEQYPIVLGSSYVDSCHWTPEEVNAFQDAIYKTEKDFGQVAQELGNKTVKECIEFYYTWKKACPDDYRKLRNLRRKRQLLEINMQNEQQQMEDGTALKKCSIEEPPDDDIEILNHSTLPPFQGLQNFMEGRQQAHSFSAGLLAMASPLGTSDVAQPSILANSCHSSHSPKDLSGMQRNYQPSVPRGSVSSGSKKGAQPSADGFFHCRLCDKCFEKVKSLNAHMKSHAMKARAEAEAKAQVDAQIAAQNQMNQNTFSNGTLNLSNLPATLQGLAQGISPNGALTSQADHYLQNLLAQQGLGLPQHARAAIPLLQQHINHTAPIIN